MLQKSGASCIQVSKQIELALFIGMTSESFLSGLKESHNASLYDIMEMQRRTQAICDRNEKNFRFVLQ